MKDSRERTGEVYRPNAKRVGEHPSRPTVEQGSALEAARRAPDKAHRWRWRPQRCRSSVPKELIDWPSNQWNGLPDPTSERPSFRDRPKRGAARRRSHARPKGAQEARPRTPLKVRVYGRGLGAVCALQTAVRLDGIRATPGIPVPVRSAREVSVFGRANASFDLRQQRHAAHAYGIQQACYPRSESDRSSKCTTVLVE